MSNIPLAIELGNVRFGNGSPFALIAGPCVIESEEHVHRMARSIGEIAGPFVFKASFDKANRTSLVAYRGPGLAEGLRILAGIKAAGYPVLTDIHEPCQAAPAAEAVDILQIPAFLCRQTDLLVEAGRTGSDREHQEGPIRLAAGYAARGGEGGLDWKFEHPADRAWLVIRL